MRACIIFDTRYGNTGKIARSFETGLKEAGIQTVYVNGKDVAVDSLKQHDLIRIGAPTEGFTASKPMKEFLGKLKSIDSCGSPAGCNVVGTPTAGTIGLLFALGSLVPLEVWDILIARRLFQLG